MDILLSLRHPRYLQSLCGWLDGSPPGKIGTGQKLIEQSCEKQGIQQDQLIIHSDRGPSMTSKLVALLLADLGGGYQEPFKTLRQQ